MISRLARTSKLLCNAANTRLCSGARSINDLDPKVTLKVAISNTLSNRPGSILPILEAFKRYSLNVTHMESQLHQYSFGDAMFEFDIQGTDEDTNTRACFEELRDMPHVSRVTILPARTVPWFPTSPRELDQARSTLDGGIALINQDHPGFSDESYKARRSRITENARGHAFGLPIPIVDYTEQEHETWGMVYDRLHSLHQDYACDDYNRIMAKFNRYGILTRDRVPQLADVSEFLHGTTGFQIRPVQGLLSARDFLNSLAFRVFWSTQYIRHHSNPFYTPEPDICHELLGHVPLFSHPDFAEFSQTIGLASLGATDAQIDRLATLYWFTVEFGVLQTGGGYKAYGAGLLSSIGELEWACASTPSPECRRSGGLQAYEEYSDMLRPQMSPLVAAAASRTAFPITTYQPQYFTSPSLAAAKEEVMSFCDTLLRPFFCAYDPFTQRINVSRSIRRAPQSSTADMQASKQADFFKNLKRTSVGELRA